MTPDELRDVLGPRRVHTVNGVEELNRAEFLHRLVVLYERIHQRHPEPTRADVLMQLMSGFDAEPFSVGAMHIKLPEPTPPPVTHKRKRTTVNNPSPAPTPQPSPLLPHSCREHASVPPATPCS
jgi:hypothetical protein